MSDIYNYVRIYEILFFLASTYSDVAHPTKPLTLRGNRVRQKFFIVSLAVIRRLMQAAAFASFHRALHNQHRDLREVAKLDESFRHFCFFVECFRLIVYQLQAAQCPLEA